ncbi:MULTISPECIES: UPF0058 family protein [unclassified Halorhabdus]|uniref:UPF0058 family protein n=1 Tax=unclassified Halorhabdus TaxID=2621901 RepID=UPI0023DCC78D|nr:MULTISPECIES: UPF0058 family protein [unclassified Halorhabdus]WEL16975.1 Putative metal-binding protein [Halorhabdus sp. SVX81]WEL20854.1 Putative metal-binding protein [Halorhabdus sp. BNX81]
MKKQELIHLHGLLAQVRDHYEQTLDTKVDHQRYTELGVKPTSIHKSKTDHKAAVFALAEGITGEMESTTDTERVSATAD